MSGTTNALAIIIPVYNEGKAIKKNFTEIYHIVQEDKIPCRFLLIDDGSKDNTWQEICALAESFEGVEALRFARNFGKEVALCAGIDYMEADRYLIMDSDLQHPPRFIKPMLELMDREQADIVNGIKKSRGRESLLYKAAAKSFYNLLKNSAGLDMQSSSDFKLMSRKVVDNLRRFTERNIFFRGLVDWVGFKNVAFYFEVDERANGTSRFSALGLFKLAFNAILSYTSKPLFLTVFAGLIFLIFAVILGIQTLYNYFSGRAVSGFSTVILLLLFIGSFIMLSIGIIGAYISRIFDEVKGRPRYIVSEHIK